MKRRAFFIPDPQDVALKALAKQTDLPVADHVRRAIAEYLSRNAAVPALPPSRHEEKGRRKR